MNENNYKDVLPVVIAVSSAMNEAISIKKEIKKFESKNKFKDFIKGRKKKEFWKC